jgi:Tfp pilus assembly protein PilN
MGQFNLNLSTRPFKAYRGANLGLLILLVVLITVSAAQVYTYQQNSALAAGIRGNQQRTKEESERLTKELQALNAQMYSGNAAAKMSQVEILNQILLRKSFSWTKVFANLEEVIPENVYLLSLRPFIDEKGNMGLNITFRGRSFADGHEFVKTLENSNIFSNIALAEEKKNDSQAAVGEVEMILSAYYLYVPEKEKEEGE